MQISKLKLKKIIFTIVFVAVFFVCYLIIDKIIDNRQQIEADRPAKLEAIKLVDETCEYCFDLNDLLDILKEQNVIFKNIQEVNINDQEGQDLISNYNITKIPVLFIKGEINKDKSFKKLWEGFGEEKDETLFSNVFPPYKDLSTEEITGLVDTTIIYDKECQQCYNTNIHLTYLEIDGIKPVNIKKLDVNESEAQQLIDKYNITKIPTIILSSEAVHYKKFTEGWQDDGKIADDGSFIFTATEKIGTYKDLENNIIINK